MTSMGAPYVCFTCRRELSLRLSHQLDVSRNARNASSLTSTTRRHAITRPSSLEGYQFWDPREGLKHPSKPSSRKNDVPIRSQSRPIAPLTRRLRPQSDILKISRSPDEVPIPRPSSRPSPDRHKTTSIPPHAHSSPPQLDCPVASFLLHNSAKQLSHAQRKQKRRRKDPITNTATKDKLEAPQDIPQSAVSHPDLIGPPSVTFIPNEPSEKPLTTTFHDSDRTSLVTSQSTLPHLDSFRSVEDDFMRRILEGRKDFTGPYSRPRKSNNDTSFPRHVVPSTEHLQLYSSFPAIHVLSSQQSAEPTGMLLHSSLLPRPLTNSHDQRDFSFQSTPLPSQSFEARLAHHADEASISPTMLTSTTPDPPDPPVIDHFPDPIPPQHAPANSRDSVVAPSYIPASFVPAPTSDYPVDRPKTRKTPELLREEIRQHLFDIGQTKLTAEDAWSAFLTILRKNGLKALKSRRDVTSTLIMKVTSAWCEGRSEGLMITPVILLRRYSELGIEIHDRNFIDTLHTLLKTAMDQARGVPQTQPVPALVEVATEILNVWDWWLSTRGNSSITLPGGQSLTWQSVTSSEQMKSIASWSSKSIRQRFDKLFPHMDPKGDRRAGRERLLVGCYGVSQIVIERDESGRFRERALPFLTFVSMLGTHADVSTYLPSAMWSHLLGSDNKTRLRWTLRQYFVHTIPRIAQYASSSDISRVEQTGENRYVASMTTSPTHLTADAQKLFSRRISRAIDIRDHLRLEQLWKEAMDWSDRDETFWNERLFEAFLRGYMLAHQPQRSIEVWNMMLANGIKPDAMTYGTMITGFGRLRDAQGVEAMWSMMIEAGVEPECGTWIHRIRAYSSAGWWKTAVRSFEQMLSQWIEACKLHNRNLKSEDLPALGDFDKAPKPNAKALTAAISTIPKGTERELIYRLLGYCKTIGVIPDAYTYNVLLLGALKQDDHDDLDRIFSQMQEHGIEPDVATFTMLVNSIFRDDGLESTLTERMKTTSSLLRSVEAHGLEANSWTYTTIINGLLKTTDLESKHYDGIDSNIEAAYAVMRYMQEQEIPLTTGIYTALLTALFAERPQPNIPTIDALWDQACLDKSVVLDEIFYDRLIEGYARVGQVSKVKMALAKAAKNQRSPGWLALTQTLKAFVKVGDWSSAEDLVHNVRAEDAARTPRIRIGKAYFIETAKEYALDVQSLVRDDDWASDTTRLRDIDERLEGGI